MTAAELQKAQKVLATFETNIERYDLDYGYDEDLNEDPDVPEDMDDYSETLIAAARVDMETPEADRDWQEIAKNLGLAGALRKITGKISEAEKLLSYSLFLCEQHKLPLNLKTQQIIRLTDVKRRQGRLQEALQELQGLLKQTSENADLANYQDVVIQHTGKVYFAMGEFPEALKNFETALSMRTKKGDEELIASSKTAIAACRKQIQ